jgi:hypothetical protein
MLRPMPINVAGCTTVPTTVSLGNFNGGAFVPAAGSPNHRIYTAANCRVTLHPTPNVGAGVTGITSLDPQADPAGDTIFLPFATDEICSMELPDPAAAALANTGSFLTTNLSGCMFFVDRIVGGNGAVVVYHANNQANAPGGHLGGLQPTLELPPCTARLTQLYNLARADYVPAPYNLNLLPGANVGKPVYNHNAMAEVQRKTGQGRANVEFTGGTIVFGVVNGANWEFYWATYGSTEYDRPGNAPKGWFGNTHRNPTNSTTPGYRVLGSNQFF